MALLKLAVLPVIGVLWTQLVTYHSSLVNPDQAMLRFVMILLSGGYDIVISSLTVSSHSNYTSCVNPSICSSGTRNGRAKCSVCVIALYKRANKKIFNQPIYCYAHFIDNFGSIFIAYLI